MPGVSDGLLAPAVLGVLRGLGGEGGASAERIETVTSAQGGQRYGLRARFTWHPAAANIGETARPSRATFEPANRTCMERVEMPKISIIGAGGYVFPLTLIRDICAFPALRGSTISLMDIDAARLERNADGARALVEQFDLPTVIEATTDRRESLAGADFVVVTYQVGGLEAYAHDVEIPRRYGVDQPVGDTMGPGGVFRGLRTIEVLKGL